MHGLGVWMPVAVFGGPCRTLVGGDKPLKIHFPENLKDASWRLGVPMPFGCNA